MDHFEAITEKIQILTKRLRDEGLKFSDKPTQTEIDKIKKESERKKDMEGINSNDILSPTKKRRIDSNATTSSSSSTGATTSSTSSSTLHKSTASKTGSSLSSNTDSKPAESSSSSSSSGGASKVKKPVQYNSSDEEGDF